MQSYKVFPLMKSIFFGQNRISGLFRAILSTCPVSVYVADIVI